MLIFAKFLRPIGVILAAAIALGPSSVVAQDDPGSRSNVNLRGGQNESHHDKLTGLQRPDEMTEGDNSSTELVLLENTDRHVAKVEEFSVRPRSSIECDAVLDPPEGCPDSTAMTEASFLVIAWSAEEYFPLSPGFNLVMAARVSLEAEMKFEGCLEKVLSEMMVRGIIAAGWEFQEEAKETACELIEKYSAFLRGLEELRNPDVDGVRKYRGLYNPAIHDLVAESILQLNKLIFTAKKPHMWRYTTGLLIDMVSKATELGMSQMSALCSPGEQENKNRCASVGRFLQTQLDDTIGFLETHKPNPVDEWWKAGIQDENAYSDLVALQGTDFASLCCDSVAKYPELVEDEFWHGLREATSSPTPSPTPEPLPPLKVTVKSIKCLVHGDGWPDRTDEIWLEKNGHQVWPVGSGDHKFNKGTMVHLSRHEKEAASAHVSSKPIFVLKDLDPIWTDTIGTVEIKGSEIKYPDTVKYGRGATATSKKVWKGAGKYEIEFEFAYEADWT